MINVTALNACEVSWIEFKTRRRKGSYFEITLKRMLNNKSKYFWSLEHFSYVLALPLLYIFKIKLFRMFSLLLQMMIILLFVRKYVFE